MALGVDPEIAEAVAPMADFTPSAVGDIAARCALWEPIIGAAGTAQLIPADVKFSEHYATAGDGTHIRMRWYVNEGARPGTAVHCRSSTAVPRNTPSRHRSKTPTAHCAGCMNTPPNSASTRAASA